MFKFKGLVSFLILTVMVFSISGCGLIVKTEEGVKNTVVAAVGNKKITKGEFDNRFEGQKKMYEKAYNDEKFFENVKNKEIVLNIKSQFLSMLADEMLLLKKAEELKVVPEKNELEKETLKRIEEDKKDKTDEEFKKEIEDFGITLEEYKENIRKSVIIDKLYELIVKDVKVSDSDISNYYNTNLYNFTEQPNVMNISRILVESDETAKKVIEEYNNGAKFEELAKKYSKEAETKDKGGALGEVKYNDSNYDKFFLAAAIAVEKGKISPPIQTTNGYYIIKMNSKKEFPAKPLADVKESIKNELLLQAKDKKYSETLQEWKEKIKIKLYPERL